MNSFDELSVSPVQNMYMDMESLRRAADMLGVKHSHVHTKMELISLIFIASFKKIPVKNLRAIAINMDIEYKGLKKNELIIILLEAQIKLMKRILKDFKNSLN